MGNSSSSRVGDVAAPSACPVVGDGSVSACPVIGDGTPSPVYNVYNQQINSMQARELAAKKLEGGAGMFPGLRKPDGGGVAVLNPANNMPVEANQLPAPGQTAPVSTTREVSTIPKGGTNATWVYPSPQMFYNALVRKNKAEDCSERDMESVVSVHNAMNEMTWRTVAQWESLHAKDCSNSRLSRFLGRPHDLSPRAYMWTMLGHAPPFDRHDWYLDRCGTEVRYIIDYYFDENLAGSMDAFTVDVRPAMDSFDSCLDRVKMNIYKKCYKMGIPCPITGDASSKS